MAELSEATRGVLLSSMSPATAGMMLGRSAAWVERQRKVLAEPVQRAVGQVIDPAELDPLPEPPAKAAPEQISSLPRPAGEKIRSTQGGGKRPRPVTRQSRVGLGPVIPAAEPSRAEPSRAEPSRAEGGGAAREPRQAPASAGGASDGDEAGDAVDRALGRMVPGGPLAPVGDGGPVRRGSGRTADRTGDRMTAGPPRHDVGRSTSYGAFAAPMAGGPGIPVLDDARLVKQCLAGGGFPRLERVEGRMVWLWPRYAGASAGARA